MSSYVDFSFIDKQILRYGEPVTLEAYSNKVYSNRGDLVSQTTTYYSITSIFNTYGLDTKYDKEGQFGEIRFSFFFKGTQTGVSANNVIQRANGERWVIKKSINHALAGTTRVSEALVTNL